MTPNLASIPPDYDRASFDRLMRTIEFAFAANHNSAVFGRDIDYSSLPTGGYNVHVGGLYVDAGVLKVVRSTDVFTPSLSGTGSIGSVTAT